MLSDSEVELVLTMQIACVFSALIVQKQHSLPVLIDASHD
jgi:hypothetical protein